MKQCPLTKEQCTNECAWFRESRRKYPDHVEGMCAFAKIPDIKDELQQIKNSIEKLNQTIMYKSFTE